MSKFRSLLAAVSILLCAAILPVNGGLPKRHPAIAGYFLFQQDIPAKTVVLKGQGSTPANPSAGWYKLFVDSTGALKLLDSSGGVTTFGAGGGGFELQTETSFTDNSTPAIFLKSPADNNTAFLRLVDSADATLAEVDSSGVGRFYSVEFPDGSDGIVNAISNMLRLQSDGFGWAVDSTGALRLESADASVAGIPKSVIHLPVLPSHSGITASTEYKAFWSNNSPTYTWATGALTTNRFFHLTAPTMAFAGSSTVTTAATLAISGSPIAGSNATITNSRALWVESGVSQFDGNVSLGSSNALLLGGATSPGTATRFQLGTPTTANNDVNVYIEPTATTVSAIAIQSQPSQTADLFQVFASNGVKIFSVQSTGVPSGSPTGATSTTTGLGYQALGSTPGTSITAIGYRAGAAGGGSLYNVIVGDSAGEALTSSSRNVIIGSEAGKFETAINDSIIFGYAAFQVAAATYTGSGGLLVVGRAAGNDLTTQSNVAVFGSSTTPLNDWYFGRGYSATGPTDITFQPSIGSGADKAGADFFIRGGAGTGDGEPGTIQFQATSPLASGSTAQTQSTIATITYGGLELNAGRFLVPQIKGTGSAPSIIAGAGAGTGASASVTGTNLAGEITFTTGTTPTADGTVITLTFSSALFNAGFPQMTPANNNAASLWSGQEDGSPMVYAECSTTVLTIKVNGALPESTTYKVNYFIPQ